MRHVVMPVIEESEEAMSDVKLLPCPFCGGESEIMRIGNCYTKSRKAVVRCKGCNIQKVVGAIVNNLDWCEANVVEQWNRRAPSAVERELRECLAKAVDMIEMAQEAFGKGGEDEAVVEECRALLAKGAA